MCITKIYRRKIMKNEKMNDKGHETLKEKAAHAAENIKEKTHNVK